MTVMATDLPGQAVPPPARLVSLPDQGEPVYDQLGPVTIGAREIYDELKTVGGKVDKVDSKVDGVDSKVDGVVTEVADHETRIRALEKGRWPLPSLAALLAFGSLIVALIGLLGKGG